MSLWDSRHRTLAPTRRFPVGWLALSLSGLLCAVDTSAYAAEVGVLVLAHGGSRRWNRQVEAAIRKAQLAYPTEIVFGMGMHPGEVHAVQWAVDELQRQGARRIIAVPLLVSSYSEVARQYQYLLGLRDRGMWEETVRPVARHVPLEMARALDEDPVVGEVLLDRARELSRAPTEESVVLVAHGPVSDEDDARWLVSMGRVAQHLQQAGQFRAVVPVTLRDDAPHAVRAEAESRLREVVFQHSQQGRVLVVPLLIANGGIEHKIPKALKGLRYAYSGKALLPHDKLSQWVARRVEAAAKISTQASGLPGPPGRHE